MLKPEALRQATREARQRVNGRAPAEELGGLDKAKRAFARASGGPRLERPTTIPSEGCTRCCCAGWGDPINATPRCKHRPASQSPSAGAGRGSPTSCRAHFPAACWEIRMASAWPQFVREGIRLRLTRPARSRPSVVRFATCRYSRDTRRSAAPCVSNPSRAPKHRLGREPEPSAKIAP